MSETPIPSLKRHRGEEKIHSIEEDTLVASPRPNPYKRHKSYTHILSLLDDDEEDEEGTEPIHQDFSSIFTTLQQELSSESVTPSFDDDPMCFSIQGTNPTPSEPLVAPETCLATHGEGDEKVMLRHLLEASDDELGLPRRTDGCDDDCDGVEGINGGDGFGFGDGSFWELEDETANYYTLLQSELFMME